ncbi:hypothetical protein RHMOL_Rhmol01G0214900 [Rhododendron molle]|uniref:Uncharacterized protein n=1 Tax=Rhododendron molle TaxID=49168 RepID=A0ACC0Q729_RHOML|nr:hypothetical protein RHMOL_Rhmol01G0214900 [Rhododendron molle]
MARRIWSEVEESRLLSVLTSLTQTPMWNAAQGTFNPAYMNYVQAVMDVEFPDAAIEEIHIKTKIFRWKQTCKVILNLMHTPGFDWDPARHEVVAEDHVWATYLQDHPKAQLARGVQFPQFNDWCLCFVPRRNP